MKKIFLVKDKENEGFLNQYESLYDAVVENEEHYDDGIVPVYTAVPELIGTYKAGTKIIKVKAKTT